MDAASGRRYTQCISVIRRSTGARMETKIVRWGNSLGLRIPKSFAEELEVEAGSTIDISVEDGSLVVRPARRGRYELAAMLKAITPGNIHESVETGAPAGREVW